MLVSALDRWPLTGVPDNPAARLMTACRNRALNRLRDEGRARDRAAALAMLLSPVETDGPGAVDHGTDEPGIQDNRLRLMFICCHA